MADPAVTKTATATWETPYAEDVWQRLTSVKTEVQTEPALDDDGESLMLGPSLPNIPTAEPRIGTVVVQRHVGGDVLNWQLIVRRAPMSEPPPEVVAANEKIGGHRGLARIIGACFPKGQPPVASFRIKVIVPQSSYSCRLLPHSLLPGSGYDVALSLGRNPQVEQIGFRFGNGVSGIEEVSVVYLHEEKFFALSIVASGPLRLDAPTWVPYVDEITDLTLVALFDPEKA